MELNLQHAGPAPIGTMFVSLLPDYTLRTIGREFLDEGTWPLGGFVEHSEQVQQSLEAQEGATFEEFALFATSPGQWGERGEFALAIEPAMFGGQPTGEKVITLYTNPDHKSHTHLGEIFRQMHTARSVPTGGTTEPQ